MAKDPFTGRTIDDRTPEDRYEAVKKAVMKVFEEAAEGCSEEQKQVLEDVAPVVRDAVAAGIRAYNPRSDYNM